MGTNFYIRGSRDGVDYDAPEAHVGKRSAAGLYCWDDGITLCEGGPDAVHSGQSGWYKTCPRCKQEPIKESLDDSAAGRELGFNKKPPERLTGVRSAASFTWAMPPERFSGLCGDGVKFEDEYGRELSADEMLQAVGACPLHFFDAIGTCFS